MSFNLWDNLEAGSQSHSLTRLANARALSASVHYAKENFGRYLNNASDERDFADRLSYIKSDLVDLVKKTSSAEHYDTVVSKLKESWNFDKKKDDDSSDSKSKSDKDPDDDGDDDSDSSDSDSDDDSDTPDFVDTDKGDDDERKESKVNAIFAKANERFAGPSNDPYATPGYNDGDPNGHWGENAGAGPKHLNPSNTDGPQWENSVHNTRERTLQSPNGGASAVFPVQNNQFGVEHFPEGFEGAAGPSVAQFDHPNYDSAKAEGEKAFPETGAPGQHRAPYPVVARNAKRSAPITAADLPRVARNSK